MLGCSQLPPRRTDGLSIVQGVTSAKEVEFSVLAPKGRSLRFELRDASGEIIAPDESKIIDRSHSDYVVYKLIFGREQERDYNIYVFEGQKLIDQRLIGRGASNPDNLRMAIASCLNDNYSKKLKIWDELQKRNPEYLLLLGDNVYADLQDGDKKNSVDPEVIWDRYVDVRLRLPLFFQQKLIPIHAIWDDHDFGSDGGNTEFKYKKESLDIFRTFWAQELAEENWTPGFGAGGLLGLGDFNLYFLDARSFRSAKAEGKHLGLDQDAWLLKRLAEEPGPSFLIKGDQFFGGYHGGESFEGSHPADFTQFMAGLGKLDTPFIFLSGDRQMSEIMQFPRGLFKKPSFEITSGPIHNDMTTSPELINPWRVVAEKDRPNFVLINNLAKDNHWFVDVESIGEDGQVYFQRELAVYIKDLQDNLQEVRKKRRSGSRRYKRIRQVRKRR